MMNENFSEAVNYFRDFLGQNNISKNIVWLFREDVIRRGNQFLINRKSISGNDGFTENLFEFSRERNSAISLYAFCQFYESVGCSIISVEDDIDAEYRLMSKESLKCSFKTKLDEAKLIKNDWIWRFYKTFADAESRKFCEDFLPFKGLAVSI